MAYQRPDRRGFEKVLYDQHVERIRNMRGTVDNKPPRPHPLSNRTEIDKRRKYAAIEFDNRLLLDRLAKIVNKKTIDNQVHESVDMQKTFKAKLSINKKKMEAQKITSENRRLLQRIQEVPPVYNHVEWEVEAKQRESNIKHMLLYPEFYEKRLEETKSTKKLPELSYSFSNLNLNEYKMNTDRSPGGGGGSMMRLYPLSQSTSLSRIQTAPVGSTNRRANTVS